jgi:hypothetical protein
VLPGIQVKLCNVIDVLEGFGMGWSIHLAPLVARRVRAQPVQMYTGRPP